MYHTEGGETWEQIGEENVFGDTDIGGDPLLLGEPHKSSNDGRKKHQ
jgi:hypothetical protein